MGDRALEFHRMREFINKTILPTIGVQLPGNLAIGSHGLFMGAKSCEDIACDITRMLLEKNTTFNGHLKRIKVTVFEDECQGGGYEWNAPSEY